METRTFEIGDETLEVRALNTHALILHEKSLLKQGIAKDTNEAGVELARILLVSWVKGGKDLVAMLPREKVREELSEYDSLMVRIVTEAKSLGSELGRRYEADKKN